jgi:hypothetical protein
MRPQHARFAASISRSQRGVAMMVLIVVLVMGATYFILRSVNASTTRADRHRVTQEALIRGKEALIARAVADDNRPGSLPCPDTDDDGSAELFVGNDCPSYIGRLPWKTLDLPDLRDASGERLWYALSSSFRDDTSAQPINSNTVGTLTITGPQAATNVAAIVFSPSQTIRRSNGVSQSRGCTGGSCDATGKCTSTPASLTPKCNVVNHLDLVSGTSDTTFASAEESNTFNDRLIPILSDDIMPLVEKRAGRELAQKLRDHFDAWSSPPAVANTTFTGFKGFYPWPATFNDPSVASPGVTNTTAGLLPFNASSAVWTSATSSLGACSGINTTQIVCSGLMFCINFPAFSFVIPCVLTVSGRVSNVSTAFLDPPGASAVTISGSGIGTVSSTWTLNKGVAATQSTQNLDFSLGNGSFLPGVDSWISLFMTVTVNAPAASAWTSSSWLATNGWNQVSHYALSPDYSLPGTNPASCATCVTISNTSPPSNSNQAVVITAGRALSGQTARPPSTASLNSYLENGNTNPSDLALEKNLRTPAFNDQLTVVRP